MACCPDTSLWRRWARCAAALAVLLGLLCSGPSWADPATAGAEAAVVSIQSLDGLLAPAGREPQKGHVGLPFRWDKAYPGLDGRMRLQVLLQPSAPGQAQALLFDRLGNQAQVWVNGVLLHQMGRLGDASTDGAKASLMVAVPAVVLRPGEPAQLVLELSAQALRAGGLAGIQYGPLSEVQLVWAQRQLLERPVSAAYAATLLMMGGLALGLWWRQRDPLYGCFGLAAVLGAARHLDAVLQVPWLPWPWWGGVLAICYGSHLALIARFILHALGRHPPWLVRTIQVALVGSVVLPVLSFSLSQPMWWTLALTLLEAAGLACFGLVAIEAVRGQRSTAWPMLVAGGVALVAGVHDIVFVRMGLDGSTRAPLTPHAVFLFVLILAGMVVARYSRTVADYRSLNASLAERIAEREQQLQAAFDALQAQQQEQAVQQERQRIMREIHDGIGSQLVGLLSLVNQPEVKPDELSAQVKLALDEMRMAVDSLQPVHDDLTAVLATLRYRLQPRLEAAGLAVQWQVSELPPIPGLSPAAILQLQRILLEAFTNIIKHAGARTITVSAELQPGEPPQVHLSVADDGLGWSPDASTAARVGQGVRNMQARAQAIGAQLRWQRLPAGGTCVGITWPMRPPAG